MPVQPEGLARMKMNKKPLPISTICAWEKRIDPTPDYQRPPA